MVRFRQPWLLFSGRTSLAAVALLALASGCKSGSWASRPSWMGGSTPSASSLSAAPSFDGGIAKPSETAKPYPTTTTPEGYVLSDSNRAAGGAATPAAPALEPSSVVTYGSAPPAANTAAVPQDPAAPAAMPPPAATGIGPQVGPYASLQPRTDPAAAVTAGLAAAPAFREAAPPLATTAPPAGERMADARTSGWVPTPPSQPAQPMATGSSQDSRYGSATTSRFSGGGFQPQPMAAPGDSADPSLMPPAVADPTLPAAPPAAAQPVADPSVPAATPALPGGIQPPARRPDPGYRPGGTSSYRPARSLLAGEDEAPAVQPVGFTAP